MNEPTPSAAEKPSNEAIALCHDIYNAIGPELGISLSRFRHLAAPVIDKSRHSGQAVHRQGEWQKRRYPHARSDSDSWDIYVGETLIVGDLMEDECDKIITAHNAALAAARQRAG